MDRNKVTRTGTLFIVATPIGNLEDITFRAVRVLAEVGLIACEDTRRTRKLLAAYAIHTPLTSLHDYNEEKKSALLMGRLTEGVDVAYVTDAGTPGISDPGYRLINQAIRSGIDIVPVPGVSAIITALSVSGLPMDSFVFLGFPPHKASQRKRFLAALTDEPKTLVFFESPKRLLAALRDMEEIWGNRKCVLARELTKVFEEVLRGSIAELIPLLEGREIKGELTLLVAGGEKSPSVPIDDVISHFHALEHDAMLSRRDIVGRIVRETGLPRRKVYQQILKHDKG